LITTASSTVWATSASTWLESRIVRPSLASRSQEVAQPADPLRIETVGRLVEDEDHRVADEGFRQAQALVHPEREPAHLAVGGALKLHEAEELVHARARDPSLGGPDAQMIPPGARRMRRGFEHHPDLAQGLGEVAIRAAGNRRAAGRGRHQAQQHRNVVVLPDPFGPRKPAITPASMLKLRSSIARTEP
jgi:hypothetical protein